MGGLLHTAQSHGSNKAALILCFKNTKIQTFLYSQLGFYKHALSLCVKFIKKKFILLSLPFSLFACTWQPLLLQFHTFTRGEETCIMIYILLGCFPIRNKEGGKQFRKLRDWPPRYTTTHMSQCLFSVWHKFSSCPVLSILPNQTMIKDVKGWSAMLAIRKTAYFWVSEDAVSETALRQNQHTIAQRTWFCLSAESKLSLDLRTLTSVPF